MSNTKKTLFDGGPRNLVIGLSLFVIALLIMNKLTDISQQVATVPYSQFVTMVDQKQVQTIAVQGNDVVGKSTDDKQFEVVVPSNDPSIWQKLREAGVEVTIIGQSSLFNFWMLGILLSFLLSIGIAWYFIRQARGGGAGGNGAGGLFTMGKSRAKMFLPSMIKETFASVAGAQEAKEELYDIIDYLRDPEKYKRLGAKMVKGILLIGEPGNGKTLLARAVAGEANCPFFSISGSDFIEVFVGVGAARVRDLFSQARKNAPCIVFIDEIDAVGRHRGSGQGGGHDEREQTLNQLLTEMDGFEVAQDPIIVIAATNRPDVLDKALLRPGRFDRQVHVPYPDLTSRQEILRVHVANIKLDPSVDLAKLAQGTPGFSGADLANLVNEAALHASKKNGHLVAIEDFEEARDKIMLGRESRTIRQTMEDLKVTAYHESGHALIPLLLPDLTDPLHKLTIVPRGKALGVTHTLPEREKYSSSREEMIAMIMKSLGGRIAEEIVFGTLRTGAFSDFKSASAIARRMVCDYGMSELGPIIYSQDYHDYNYSEKTAGFVEELSKNIIDEAYAQAKQLLIDNRTKLDLLALTLLDKQTMYASEVYELLGLPPRQDLRLV
ncbi:ATP-dependent zinc metalloprotease FtsH [Candidatus Dependentiae bacterium]|nr:ATP-dependent zinc metalloprotease FtsH [Candidatus Dependentiae bacterium]